MITLASGWHNVSSKLVKTYGFLLSLAALCLLSWWALHQQPILPPTATLPIAVVPYRYDQCQILSQAAARATSSIHAASMQISAVQLIEAWKAAAARGVTVQIWSSDPRPSPKLLWRLGKSTRSGLFHPKIMVVDRQELWIGSGNYHVSSMQEQANLLIGLYSRQLGQSIAAALEGCSEHMSGCQRLGPGQVRWRFLPDKHAIRYMMAYLAAARCSIFIAAFWLSHPAIIKALCDALERGVAVKVLHNNSNCDQIAHRLKTVVHLGGSVRVWDGNSILHHKTVWIDSSTLIFGSTNLTASGWKKNREIWIVLEGQKQDVNLQIEKVMTTLWGFGRPIEQPRPKMLNFRACGP